MATDANNEIFPLNFAVVDDETGASWGWFYLDCGPRYGMLYNHDKAALHSCLYNHDKAALPQLYLRGLRRFCMNYNHMR